MSPKNWRWNYTLKDNPNLQNKLKKLVGDYIKPLYDEYSKKFLNEKALDIVNKNPSLTFHFIYAVWNGRSWFRKFSDLINEYVDKGVIDPYTLNDIMNKARKNSNSPIISKSAEKISQITNNIKTNIYT